MGPRPGSFAFSRCFPGYVYASLGAPPAAVYTELFNGGVMKIGGNFGLGSVLDWHFFLGCFWVIGFCEWNNSS